MNVGIDPNAIDPNVRPQDDLYGFVNGGWLQTASIPDDRSRYGAFDMLVEQSETAMRAIVEEAAAASTETDPSTPQGRVGALFASFMDTDRVNATGWGAIDADLSAIADASTPAELLGVIGQLERGGMSGLFGMYVTADAGQPDTEIAYLVQGGLGLPDRDYYLADDHGDTRAAYMTYLNRIIDLASDALGRAGIELDADAAAAIVALETEIANAHWDKVDTRDALKTYNKKSFDELVAMTPGIEWDVWLDAIGAQSSALSSLVVAQPDTLEALSELFSSRPLADWKAWTVANLLSFAAPYLHDEVGDLHFDFYGRTLSGTPDRKVRWKRGVALVESLLGDDGGRLYVERHYPDKAALRMEDLLSNVTEAFRQRIEQLEWMGAETRAEALTKLGNFRAKVGKPNEWKDYSAFVVDPADLYGNVKRGNAVETDRQLAKIGQPVDKDEWLMTPQTVNAYYHPLLNEIVFPAAILQPPFFDADAPDAINYGGIGAVIAHEIGHGFDDQGSRFDGSGALRDWWTETDRAAFDERARALIVQFNHLTTRAAPDQTVNGELTVGENIGDLCGIELAYAALQLARSTEEATTYQIGDGQWSDNQLFFLNWAQLWRTLIRPEEAKRLLAIDPHSPADLRANVVNNVDAFHEVFATTPEDGMWRASDERVSVF